MALAADRPMMTLGHLVIDAAAIFRPPVRLTVATASNKFVVLKNPPAYEGPYLPEKTPYMVEPQNMTQSRDHTALVFCGPSQTGKTEALVLNTIAYHIKCNPMDVMLLCPSQSTSRDFDKRRIAKLIKNSPEIRSELIPGNENDNTHDKTFRSGMLLTNVWPSTNELSSKPIPVVIFTEYDRMPDNIGGEGSGFILGKARTTTFRNLGMTILDSSPSRDVKDPQAKVVGHRAPECTGILGIYNEGDMRQWYWPCPHCGEFFTASYRHLVYDLVRMNGEDEVRLTYAEVAKSVYLACQVNGCRIEPHHKKWMNERGVWLREGEKILANGTRYGTPLESDTISYWLKGPAATFVTWPELVVKTIKAQRKLETTGEDDDLRTVTNTGHGEPYIPPSAKREMSAEDLMESASDAPLGIVPAYVRGLMACVDVQGNRFVVQVLGVVPGAPFEVAVIDRFEIIESKRVDADGERLWVKPAQELGDWDLIEEQVMEKRYPLISGDGTMGISMTLCDSGGKEGTTTNAYNFWRKMRDDGKADRFHLVKGEPELKAPRTRVGYPDSQRSDRHAGARGEIPVLFINTNILKDTVVGMLQVERGDDGRIVSPPKVHHPSGLSVEFFAEYLAEVRDLKGRWTKAKPRNESLDLLVYFVAGCINRRVEIVDWEAPPPWLRPWTENPYVTLDRPEGSPVQVDNGQNRTSSLQQLGALLA